jgi:hypothetical protein
MNTQNTNGEPQDNKGQQPMQTYPIPPIERFPRNIHRTAHYSTLNGMRQQHPLIADHDGKVPLMLGSMTAAAHTVWSILKRNRDSTRYSYGRIRWRRPESQKNLL